CFVTKLAAPGSRKKAREPGDGTARRTGRARPSRARLGGERQFPIVRTGDSFAIARRMSSPPAKPASPGLASGFGGALRGSERAEPLVEVGARGMDVQQPSVLAVAVCECVS